MADQKVGHVKVVDKKVVRLNIEVKPTWGDLFGYFLALVNGETGKVQVEVSPEYIRQLAAQLETPFSKKCG